MLFMLFAIILALYVSCHNTLNIKLMSRMFDAKRKLWELE